MSPRKVFVDFIILFLQQCQAIKLDKETGTIFTTFLAMCKPWEGSCDHTEKLKIMTLWKEICCLLFLYLQNQVQAFSKRTEQEVEYTELDRTPPDIFLQIGQVFCVSCFVFCVLGPEFQTLFLLCFLCSNFSVPSCVQESAELKFVF
jgi:hypothetical protein